MSRRTRLLVVDDEASILSSLRFALEDSFDMSTVEDPTGALQAAESFNPDVCLLDLRLGSADGLELLGKMRRVLPDASFVIMTAFSSIRSAVECMKRGANDYIVKPVDLDELNVVLGQAAQDARLRSTVRKLERELEVKHGPGGIIGESRAMQQVFELIEKAKWVDSNVLILGEPGVGKELAARALHFAGSRKHGPFITVNCDAMPSSALAIELFGGNSAHEASTSTSQESCIEAASGGTLFFREIGRMDLMVQAQLLHAIQDRGAHTAGSSPRHRMDVRVIAASSQSLDEAVRQGLFRDDLYRRLNVVTVKIPPLRHRRQDIPLLVHHFVEMVSRRLSRPVPGVTEAAMWAFQAADYSGNVSELEAAVEQALSSRSMESQSDLDVGDLPADIRQPSPPGSAM
ncbi:MAG: sigma-54 dependent transcriptional regulator [Clostridia bacterium]|nr:sigma-54 dependent transcriptional regulator [Clostridia bacterium]